MLRNDPEILRQLHAIRRLGVRLAIDDFGTGNSAVVYLKQFPIDVLKIDQSFVKGLSSSSEDAAITCATIAMARQLGLGVVAEGVEEQAQMDFLLRYGCIEYQGLLFSPAVPADAFAELLRSGTATASPRHEPFMRAKEMKLNERRIVGLARPGRRRAARRRPRPPWCGPSGSSTCPSRRGSPRPR